MINYQLSQKLKVLGNDDFNHLTIILTGFSNQSVDEGKSDAKEGMGKKKKKTKRNLILDFHVSRL